MLSHLRQGGIIQFFMVAVVCLIIAAFAFDFRGGLSGQDTVCVARIGSDCIPPKDFRATRGLARFLGEDQNAGKIVADGLIERELLVREAKRLGLAVSEQAVDDELELGRAHYSLPVAEYALTQTRAFQLEPNPMVIGLPVKNRKTEQFDFAVYKRSVQTYARMSTKDFKRAQREELLAARMRQLVMSQVRVSEAEAFSQYKHANEKAVVRVAHLNNKWFERYSSNISAEAVDKYLADNADAVNTAYEPLKERHSKACRVASQIYLNAIATTDEEKAEKKKTLEGIQRGLKAKDFAQTARRISDGPGAAVGGILGCLDEKTTPKPLLEAAKDLKDGKVSEVIETERGFYLLLLEAEAEGEALETRVKKLVASGLAREADGKARATEFANKLLTAVKEGKGLAEAAESLAKEFTVLPGLSEAKQEKWTEAAMAAERRPRIEISGSFTLAGNPVPEATGGTPASIAFALSEPDAVHPEPIETRGGLAILQLKEKTAVTKEEFEKEKDKLLRELRLMKQADALAAYVARLRAVVESDISINQDVVAPAASGDS